MRFSKKLSAIALAAVFGIAFMSPVGGALAADFDAAKHFKNKTIRLIVDFKPGGGTDTQARYFSRYWGKFLPGNPRITVSNLFPNPSGRNQTPIPAMMPREEDHPHSLLRAREDPLLRMGRDPMENFVAAVGLHFAYYNFCKRHNTIKTTPAMAAGVARKQWTIADLLTYTAIV